MQQWQGILDFLLVRCVFWLIGFSFLFVLFFFFSCSFGLGFLLVLVCLLLFAWGFFIVVTAVVSGKVSLLVLIKMRKSRIPPHSGFRDFQFHQLLHCWSPICLQCRVIIPGAVDYLCKISLQKWTHKGLCGGVEAEVFSKLRKLFSDSSRE